MDLLSYHGAYYGQFGFGDKEALLGSMLVQVAFNGIGDKNKGL